MESKEESRGVGGTLETHSAPAVESTSTSSPTALPLEVDDDVRW